MALFRGLLRPPPPTFLGLLWGAAGGFFRRTHGAHAPGLCDPAVVGGELAALGRRVLPRGERALEEGIVALHAAAEGEA